MTKKLQKEKLGKSMLEKKLERKNKKKSLQIYSSQVAASPPVIASRQFNWAPFLK